MLLNKCGFLPTGYRHIRLRTSSNQPLEVATLFIHSHCEEDLTSDSLLSPCDQSYRDDHSQPPPTPIVAGLPHPLGKKGSKTLLRMREAGLDTSRLEKEVVAVNNTSTSTEPVLPVSSNPSPFSAYYQQHRRSFKFK